MNDPDAVGPSDSSDTGADLIGNFSTDATTDRNGTGERATAGPEEISDAADIGFDRVVGASEAGLGAGLDQAEEAQLGITDEELAELDDLDE